MSRVQRSALVRARAEDVFALVDDVDAYPRRFSWCEEGRVLERGPDWRIARLVVRAAGMRVGFVTRNDIEPGRAIRLSLIEGPFNKLQGRWDFVPLAIDACRVALELDFEFAGRLVGGALAGGFRGLADRLVDDFVREARTVHG